QANARRHGAGRRGLRLGNQLSKLASRGLGRIEADQMATAINEEWDAKIGLRDCQLLDHCPKQTLAGDRRDVMEFEGNVGLRLQKLDRPMAMRASRLKEDMQAPVLLPSDSGRVLRRQGRLEL